MCCRWATTEPLQGFPLQGQRSFLLRLPHAEARAVHGLPEGLRPLPRSGQEGPQRARRYRKNSEVKRSARIRQGASGPLCPLLQKLPFRHVSPSSPAPFRHGAASFRPLSARRILPAPSGPLSSRPPLEPLPVIPFRVRTGCAPPAFPRFKPLLAGPFRGCLPKGGPEPLLPSRGRACGVRKAQARHARKKERKKEPRRPRLFPFSRAPHETACPAAET